jgi:redox-sensitive bicupin YhaK (pirin superfamily)
MNGTGPTQRAIAERESGSRHGPITRLISPNDLGERLKPFLFLDYFSADIQPGFGFGMHPHSGIATLTWQPGCDVQYEDTTGQQGVLAAGGLEWMNAGGGAWHQGHLLGSGRATGFQLWVPMPPGVEDGPSVGQYVPPEAVPVVAIEGGAVKVLLGSLATAGGGLVRSPIDARQDMNYFVLSLAEGASWHYQPPAGHELAWAFGFDGSPRIQGESAALQLLAFEPGAGAVEFAAPQGPVQVLLGSARRHAHPLVLGRSSVHTNTASLAAGEQRIREIGTQLREAGRLP